MNTGKTTYKVFVSSTYRDNIERRKIVQKAITSAGMIWYGMEVFSASTRPTAEECIRYVREADVFVGIIAWRYGWEPNGLKSITEMEYDAAQERLMFQLDPSIPVNPDRDFDSGPDKWIKQGKLEAFKKRFAADQLPTLFEENTLGMKVLQALNDWRTRREHKQVCPTPKAKPPLPSSAHQNLADLIKLYRQTVETYHESLPIAGFATRIDIPIDIEDIYIPLHAMVNLSGLRDAVFADSVHAERELKAKEACYEISLLEAFQQANQRNKRRGVVILGDPGSGKTTHLKRLLLWCLHNGSESLGLAKDMIPVFLPLRDLTKLDNGLDDFIQDQLQSPHLKMPKDFGEFLLKRGKLLLLFDGLDEVSDLSHRERVAKWITDAVRHHSTCRFVLTCRFAGYTDTVRLGAKFLEMHIRPFTEDQVARFVENWYRIVERALASDPEQASGIAAEKASHLLERLKAPDFRARRVFELTRNPLLLANICLVHRYRGDLPRKRARLYEECIDVLLEHWRKGKGLAVSISAQERRRALQPAALWLHRQEGRTRAAAKELEPRITPILQAVGEDDKSANAFLQSIRDQSGLLTGWSHDQYGFMHLGFQEYLAAREIRSRAFEDPTVMSELAEHFGESWWQEVILLLLALEDPSLFVPFMREVVKRSRFMDHSAMVEMCLDDSSERSPTPFVELVEVEPGQDRNLWERQLAAIRILLRLEYSVVEKCGQILCSHPYDKIRDLVNTCLSVGTDQIVTSERGEYELIRIPGDVFQMGSPDTEKGHGDTEAPQHTVEIADFYMGKYPVTNEQYSEFLRANLKVREPLYWADRRFNQPRQPVVGVSWEDAKRYAEWAGLRLPSEAEWEYACRAGTSTRFYTGDEEKDLDRAGWYGKNSGSQTHPVGQKEANAFGLYDMHGNVWEWVEDDWHKNYDGAPANEKAWIDSPRGVNRVLRGGSWDLGAGFCRSAFRYGWGPDRRYSYLGFRLARSVTLGP